MRGILPRTGAYWKDWREIVHDPFFFGEKAVDFPQDIQMMKISASDYQGPRPSGIENALFYNDGSVDGYYLIYGSFGFEDGHWGVALLRADGVLERVWSIEPADYKMRGAHVGLAVSEDGDIVTNTHGVLTAKTWCGGSLWEAEWTMPEKYYMHDHVLSTDYHHDITYHERSYYTFRGPSIIEVDGRSGAITKRHHVIDLIRRAYSDGLYIFDIRFKHKRPELTQIDLAELHKSAFDDPFHFNKVDILTDELADWFPDFEVGDMLVSMRELNLVFVFRPDTYEVVWYRQSLTSRQHDATYQQGYIGVFNNKPFSKAIGPSITKLSLDRHEAIEMIDLSQWGMVMDEGGNYVFDDDLQDLLTVDDDRGRVIHGRLNGTVNFMFENRVSDTVVLQLRNAIHLNKQTVDSWNEQCGE